MTNASIESEDRAVDKVASQERSLIAAGIICAISFVFLAPCFMPTEIASLFGKHLHEQQFDPTLATLIPPTIDRYRIWILSATVLLICVNKKLFGSSEKNSRPRLLEISIFTILLDMLIFTRALQFPYCLDDTYIVFRYVNNILQFGCADFDVGTHVHAISSQLHLWMLVAFAALTGVKNLAILSQSINLAFEITSLFVLFLLLKGLFKSNLISLYGCAVHVMWVYNFLGVAHGKESSATIFCLFLFLWSQVSQRKLLGGWAAALLSMARPEGAVVFITALLGDMRSGVQKPLAFMKPWLLPLAFIASVYLSIYLYYGTILPQGMLLKSTIYNIEPCTTASMIVYLLSTAFLNLKIQITGANAVVALIGIYAALISLLWRFTALRTYLIALSFITAAFCSKNALIMYFPWYCAWWTPLPPLVWAAIAYQIGQQSWNAKIRKSVQLLIATASLAVLPFAYTTIGVGNVKLPIQIFYWDKVSERLKVYEWAGDCLKNVGAEETLVGIGELGIIGTVYNGKMFDLQGMVTPEALKLYPVPADKRSPTCVFSLPPQFPQLYKPGRILFLDSFGRNGMLEDKYFKDNYEVEYFWKNGTFDSSGVFLYKRKDVVSRWPKNKGKK